MKRFLLYSTKLLVIALSLLIFSIVSHKVSAQENGLDLTISPTVLELTTDPGGKVVQKFRIRNNSDQPVNLSLTVDKLSSHTTDGQVVPIKANKSDTSPTWLSFDKTSFQAPPKEWQDITVTITVPKEAAFGYYFAIRIGQRSTTVKTGTGANILGEVVLPVLLNVKSQNAKAQLNLVQFSPLSYINEYLPITFSVTIANGGNIHLKPQGNIFIRTGSEKDTATLDVNPSLGAVLPGGTRVYTTYWDDGFIVEKPVISDDGIVEVDSNHKPKMHIVFNWDRLTHFRIGKYTANLLMVYDNGTRDVPLEASTTFWVFPYTFFSILLVTILLLFFSIRFLLKWYITRKLESIMNNASTGTNTGNTRNE